MNIQKIIKKLRPIKRCTIKGKNNVLTGCKSKSIKILVDGNNNKVTVKDPSGLRELDVKIFGDNNTLLLESGVHGKFSVYIGFKEPRKAANCSLHIGKNTGSNGTTLVLLEKNSNIGIGRDCMFADGTQIWASDTHAIIDQDGHVINQGSGIKIGNRVWLGMDVKIGKNTAIADDCIVGWGSVVTKMFTEKNALIAGVPAKVLKRNVTWSKQSPDMINSRTLDQV